MPDFDVNYLAVLAATVWMMVLGFLWYGPLFGKAWLQAIGKSREELGGAAGPTILSIIGALVEALVLAWLIGSAPSPDLVVGAAYGLAIAIAFVTTNIATTAAFESRNSTLTTLSITYQIVGLTVMGAILGAWR